MPAKNYFIINLAELDNLIKQISHIYIDKTTVRLIIKKLNLQGKELPLGQMRELALGVEDRAKSNQQQSKKQEYMNNWVFGQQKLFCSILPYFCILRNLSIDSLKVNHLLDLEKIFITKTTILMYFEWKYVDGLNNNFREQWRDIDLSNLRMVMQSFGDRLSGVTKWKNISLKLFQMSQYEYFHSPRDCRQMWINHLNPDVSKSSWSVNQDLQLFTLIKEYGFKWAMISKFMKGSRTEHMIKNRVNSYIRKLKLRSKTLKQNQIDEIINNLQDSISQKQFQKYFINQQINNLGRQQQLINNKQNNKNIQAVQLFDVIDINDWIQHKFVVNNTSMQQDWQYNQQQQFIIKNNQFYTDLEYTIL